MLLSCFTHLFTVLVGNDGALCGTRVGAQHDSLIKQTSHDGRTSARRLWQRNALFAEKVVAGNIVNTLLAVV